MSPDAAQQHGSGGVALGAVALLVVGHLVTALLFLDSAGLSLAHLGWGLLASLFNIAGTVVAARAFSPGDYLRRVWGLFATGATLLFVASLLRAGWMVAGPDVPFEQSPFATVRLVLLVLVNVLVVVAPAMLVLTYRRSGLSPPSSPRFLLGYAAFVGVMAVLAVPAFRDAAAAMQRPGSGALDATVNVVSLLGDLGKLALLPFILRVAYLLRGGRLAWPWWAMTASGVAWLLFDLRNLLPDDATHASALLAVTRTAAIALVGAAGFLQRAALEPEAGPGH